MSQAYKHQLEIVRGWFDDLVPQRTSKISADVEFPLKAGRCVHLNSSDEFEPGCAGKKMPFFVMGSSDGFDVTPVDGTVEEFVQGTPIRELTCIAGIVPYEIATTEFDPERTYLINDLLRSPEDNSDADVGGILTNEGVVWATAAGGNAWTTVVGQVSSPPAKRVSNRNEVLRFWVHLLTGAI